MLSYYKMHDRPMGQTAMDRNVFIGNKLVDMFADNSGYTELFVKIDDMVTKGQKVAVQKNAFGEIVHEYISPKSTDAWPSSAPMPCVKEASMSSAF